MNTPSLRSYTILEIHTESVSVVIRARDKQPYTVCDGAASQSSAIGTAALGLKRIRIAPYGIDIAYDEPTDTELEQNIGPLFFADTSYEIVIQSKDGEGVSLWHEDADVRDGVGPITEEIKGLASGVIRFDRNIGVNKIEIYHRDIRCLSLSIEVFPHSLNYKEDHRRMLEDISECVGVTDAETLKFSVKDTQLLYKYWCFIKLTDILRSQGLEVEGGGFTEDGREDICSALLGSEPYTVSLTNKATDEKISLIYEPSVCYGTLTGEQHPTFMLELEKKGTDRKYKYVFDAKYRTERQADALYFDQCAGPAVEDIDALHKYRDAIVYDSKSEDAFRYNREIFGAYLLFPYGGDEGEYEAHSFYKSVDTVNIGGLPFLPNKTHLAESLIKQLIEESGSSALERAILPAGIADSLKQIDWEVRDVLVGSLRSRDQLEINLREGYYYAPASVLIKENFPIRYVALYQSKRFFGAEAGIRFYGEVISTARVKRRQISVPMSAGNGDEPYYVFKVRAWMMLDKPIAAQDEGLYIPKYTNKFLLDHCTHSYELFNIRSEEEFRLMQEMRRIFDDLEIEGGDAAPVYRPDDKHSIFVKDGSFVVLGEDGRTLMTMSAADFKRRPGRGFGKLAECLRKNKDGMRR